MVSGWFGVGWGGFTEWIFLVSFREADDMLPEEVRRMKKEQEAKDREEEESSDEAEEEKVVAFKKKTGQNKFTEKEDQENGDDHENFGL